MNNPDLNIVFVGKRIHLVGAKGTGMAALAEILLEGGARLSGSDVSDTFYTDSILQELGVPVAAGFSLAGLPNDTELVIHSAAYSRDKNPELLEAERREIPLLSYPEALGALSRRMDSSGIAGVHGKTTTTALAGSLAIALNLPATILAGSAVTNFGGRSTRILGDRYFIAETCEYRRHFLHFKPRRIVLTSIEPDHQDYYPGYLDILEAFVEYIRLLPLGGELIYCIDDAGAHEAATKAQSERPDIPMIAYGKKADSPWRLENYYAKEGRATFRLAGLDCDFSLRVPGEHIALDATAALALICSLLADQAGTAIESGFLPSFSEQTCMRNALACFAGSKRRSEILGEREGVLFMDDYGHHPTAIRETIRGIKAFWPSRRLVVDFMSHTYSRTKALFEEFTRCLDEADVVILHKIYASARETPDLTLSGKSLYEAVRARRESLRGSDNAAVSYYDEPMEALKALSSSLKNGDLFLTMGAGDNWKLGLALLDGRGEHS